MKGIAREGDTSTGHDTFPPTTALPTESTLILEGKSVIRVTDLWETHCNPAGVCHRGKSSSGSSVLIVDGLVVARVNDSISCGDAVSTGSDFMLAK